MYTELNPPTDDMPHQLSVYACITDGMNDQLVCGITPICLPPDEHGWREIQYEVELKNQIVRVSDLKDAVQYLQRAIEDSADNWTPINRNK